MIQFNVYSTSLKKQWKGDAEAGADETDILPGRKVHDGVHYDLRCHCSWQVEGDGGGRKNTKRETSVVGAQHQTAEGSRCNPLARSF